MVYELDKFYLNTEEPIKSCLLALRSMILKMDENIKETQKYGMPCFCYRKRVFCYLWKDKKTLEPYILMAEGHLLFDPLLEQGQRSRMKILRVNPHKDLPIKKIHAILQQGINLYKNGIIKIK